MRRSRKPTGSTRRTGGHLRSVPVAMALACLVPATATPRHEREITFTVVYDNTAVGGDLQGDWGFACLVTGKEQNVLFDTGTRSDILWANLEKLDLRPEAVDLVVLSHEHRDHTGGLRSFLERHADVTVVAPDSFSPGFFERVKAAGGRERRIQALTALGDGLWVTGAVGGAVVEQSLVVETPRGLVVLTGCGHPGVVEITRKVREAFAAPIHLVFGGFHLLRTSPGEVRGAIRELKQLGVERIGPAHCTGEEAIRLFQEGFGSGFVNMGAGRVLRIEQPLAELRGPYLGQPPPDSTPRAFAPGVVSTSHLEHSAPAFSPDGSEVYWSVWERPQEGRPQVILRMRQGPDGAWSRPEAAGFSGRWTDGGPVFSPDGRRLYFYSKRPVDGARDPEANRIWYVERPEPGEDWGAPQRPPLPDAMTASQWGPSVTADGTLYYNTPGRSNGGIDRSRRVNGQYGRAERLTERINSGHLDWTVHVAPDESYLIFSSDRSAGSGGGDLYVCFRETSGAWSKPRAMPESINTAFQERFPLVSSDGRFLFFTRWTPRHSQEVYWVGAGVIQDMKEAWLRELARRR